MLGAPQNLLSVLSAYYRCSGAFQMYDGCQLGYSSRTGDQLAHSRPSDSSCLPAKTTTLSVLRKTCVLPAGGARTKAPWRVMNPNAVSCLRYVNFWVWHTDLDPCKSNLNGQELLFIGHFWSRHLPIATDTLAKMSRTILWENCREPVRPACYISHVLSTANL